MRTPLKVAGGVLFVLFVLLGGTLAYLLVPRNDPRPLPPQLVSLTSPEGQAILRSAEARADFESLKRSFEPQHLTSFCGVASSVVVLKALGHRVTQASLFNAKASTVRPRWRVALGGMPIDTAQGLLVANGVEAKLRRADTATLEEFREAIRRNLQQRSDYLIVNYQREKLGQEPVGHISPVAAYDLESDRALIMDTASYKYPPTWVPLAGLYAAMSTKDSETGMSRGWIEVKEN